MRLLKLSANQATFRTVEFNESGVSLVIGARSGRPRSGATYNGVGKSLMIALIHHCLGSSLRKGIAKALPGWTFALELEFAGSSHRIERPSDATDYAYLDESRISLESLRAVLGEALFDSPDQWDGLSFRSLIPRFIRPGREAYIDFDGTFSKESAYHRLLRTGYLMGLPPSLVIEKARARDEQLRVQRVRRELSSDPIFKQFFGTDTPSATTIARLEREAREAREAARELRVANAYQAIEQEADLLASELRVLRNQQYRVRRSLRQTQDSLRERLDVAPDRVAELYSETGLTFPDSLVRSLAEVTDFHSKLIAARAERLTARREELDTELRELAGQIDDRSRRQDQVAAYLGEVGALDQILAVSARASELEKRLDRAQGMQGLLTSYDKEKERLKVQMADQTVEAIDDLTSRTREIREFAETFTRFTESLYPTVPSGLSVDVNARANRIRYNIEARIQSDVSDGINEAKIFAFDLAVLSCRRNHRVEVVVHDNRLFGPVDPRQRAQMLRLAMSEAPQYIASINEDHLEGMRSEFSASEYEELLDREVLRLTDDSDASKLLGLQIDLDYGP